MITRNDSRRQESLDALSRLESFVLQETDPDAWAASVLAKALDLAERWGNVSDADGPARIETLVGMYRLSSTARVFGRIPAEYFFWMLAVSLHVEAHIGPEALVNQKEYLGPLWDRREAIWANHGWPAEDEDGNRWHPADHLDQTPEDYNTWAEELDRVADEMDRAAFHAVCEKYGVVDIVELKETDPAEFERRCMIGYDCVEGLTPPESDASSRHYRSNRK